MSTFELNIDSNSNVKMFFHEWYHEKLCLEIVHCIDGDKWVQKKPLVNMGYFDRLGEKREECSWEILTSDSDYSENIVVYKGDDASEAGCFKMDVEKIQWKKWENKWLPLPILYEGTDSIFGPTNWCRFKLIPNGKNCYRVLVAFDTNSCLGDDNDAQVLNEVPTFRNKTIDRLSLSMSGDIFKLMNFCGESKETEWIDHYLLKCYHGVDELSEIKGSKGIKLTYLAEYICFCKYLYKKEIFPKVELYSNYNVQFGNVDLVVDIGNSRTCAVLFDNGDFTKSTPVRLQNFTEPLTSSGKLNVQRDSFDMRLAFRKADFGGDFGIKNSKQFIYPSFVRLGKEANMLIHQIQNVNTGHERISTFSSPKRFLWDDIPQRNEWEFVRLRGEKEEPFFIAGISEQLNSDGSLSVDNEGGLMNRYSRKALMTLSFLEIFAQSYAQINSDEQRRKWGEISKPRIIGKIIVTCPTTMSHVEQIALRKCAEDAAIMLNRFYDKSIKECHDENILRGSFKIIPSSKKLKDTEARTEWIYDEATASQFVFLFAEVKERYNKNVGEYFKLYGKSENGEQEKMTIGSVDIGAGTTDVMIASYSYDNTNGQCRLKPSPLYWESFYKAGDDLLKELVHQLIVEGPYSTLEKKIKENEGDPINIMQSFLGTDDGIPFENRKLRSDFNLQVSVPIVSTFLELIKTGASAKQLSYNDLLGDNPPATAVLDHFRKSFGFSLEDVKWDYDPYVVGAIIEKTFDTLIGKISSLFSFYKCDIVLLSGRPTSLKPLSDLFLKYYAISPNRLKTLNDYRIGRWYPQDAEYPFIDSDGYFINPKSIVTTGAMIGCLAENGGIEGFSLDLSDLKQKQLPTTKNFGTLDENMNYKGTIISLKNNNSKLSVTSLPLRIGVRQIDASSYPSRPFYVLDFNDLVIDDKVRGRYDDNVSENIVAKEIEREKENIRCKYPLNIEISRDPDDLECLFVDDVSSEKGDINKRFLRLQVQSMSEIQDYWLDSGLFKLNINR